MSPLRCWYRVLVEGPTVFKQIKNFEEYGKRQKTSLVAIQKAYATAGRAADEAKLAGHPQYLVSCRLPLALMSKQRYQVDAAMRVSPPSR